MSHGVQGLNFRKVFRSTLTQRLNLVSVRATAALPPLTPLSLGCFLVRLRQGQAWFSFCESPVVRISTERDFCLSDVLDVSAATSFFRRDLLYCRLLSTCEVVTDGISYVIGETHIYEKPLLMIRASTGYFRNVYNGSHPNTVPSSLRFSPYSKAEAKLCRH